MQAVPAKDWPERDCRTLPATLWSHKRSLPFEGDNGRLNRDAWSGTAAISRATGTTTCATWRAGEDKRFIVGDESLDLAWRGIRGYPRTDEQT